jgi:hypothetical protein
VGSASGESAAESVDAPKSIDELPVESDVEPIGDPAIDAELDVPSTTQPGVALPESRGSSAGDVSRGRAPRGTEPESSEGPAPPRISEQGYEKGKVPTAAFPREYLEESSEAAPLPDGVDDRK